MLDAHLDLLHTDIPSKHFVCFHNVFKTSSRYVFKTSSRYVFKTSSRHVLKTSQRCFQCNNFLSSKTSSRRLAWCLQDVFKTPSRHLGRWKIFTLKAFWRRLQNISWRPLQDIFKTNKCLLGFKFQMPTVTLKRTPLKLPYLSTWHVVGS